MTDANSACSPVLIVGVGRSGTSLLQSMIASHSEVAIPPEVNFVRRFIAGSTLDRLYKQGGIDSVSRFLSHDRYFLRTGLSVQDVLCTVGPQDQFSPVLLYRRMLEAFSGIRMRSRFGDKDPRGVEFLDLYHLCFPNAVVVQMIRDPRDVLVSKKSAQWSSDRSVMRHMFANAVQVRLGRELGNKLFRQNYMEVRYEDLIEHPQRELERVCDAAGLQFERGMLEFSSAARNLVQQEEFSWKKETMGELLTRNANKWPQALNAWEAHCTELACKEAMEWGQYGYSSPHTPGDYCRRAGAAVSAKLLRTGAAVYRSIRKSRNQRRALWLQEHGAL